MKGWMREGGRDGSLHNDSSKAKAKAKAKFGIISIFSSSTDYYLQGGAFLFFFYCGRSVCVCCSIVVGRWRRTVSLGTRRVKSEQSRAEQSRGEKSRAAWPTNRIYVSLLTFLQLEKAAAAAAVALYNI